MVEELFPALVSPVAEVDMDEGVVPGLHGLLYQLHARLMQALAAFPDVAGGTGTDNILPGSFAAHTPRDDVVERQFAGREMLAAVLASVPVAGENITAVEFDLGSGQAVVEKQPDNPRHGHMEIDGGYPVVPVRLEIASELAYLAPALEIVVGILALFERDHLGKVSEQQRECPLDPYYPDRHVMLVQNKNITVQTGMIFSSNHNSHTVLIAIRSRW